MGSTAVEQDVREPVKGGQGEFARKILLSCGRAAGMLRNDLASAAVGAGHEDRRPDVVGAAVAMAGGVGATVGHNEKPFVCCVNRNRYMDLCQYEFSKTSEKSNAVPHDCIGGVAIRHFHFVLSGFTMAA